MRVLLLAAGLLMTGCYSFDTAVPPRTRSVPLQAVKSGTDPATSSSEMFTELATVFRHPRCANCHPGEDRPLQRGGQPHAPEVVGISVDGPVTDCGLCHQTAWNPQTRIPGAPHWELAPKSMGWHGQTDRQICEQIKDPARTGGRTLAEVHEHIANDELVAYGWNPGPRLAPAPGSVEAFAALFEAWFKSGAECP